MSKSPAQLFGALRTLIALAPFFSSLGLEGIDFVDEKEGTHAIGALRPLTFPLPFFRTSQGEQSLAQMLGFTVLLAIVVIGLYRTGFLDRPDPGQRLHQPALQATSSRPFRTNRSQGLDFPDRVPPSGCKTRQPGRPSTWLPDKDLLKLLLCTKPRYRRQPSRQPRWHSNRQPCFFPCCSCSWALLLLRSRAQGAGPGGGGPQKKNVSGE